MKAHIARNKNAGVPLALGWNLSAADRGILEGMAPAFGMTGRSAGRTKPRCHCAGELKTVDKTDAGKGAAAVV